MQPAFVPARCLTLLNSLFGHVCWKGAAALKIAVICRYFAWWSIAVKCLKKMFLRVFCKNKFCFRRGNGFQDCTIARFFLQGASFWLVKLCLSGSYFIEILDMKQELG